MKSRIFISVVAGAMMALPLSAYAGSGVPTPMAQIQSAVKA